MLPVGRFSRTIGLVFRCVAGNFLLLRVAFFWAVFAKYFGTKKYNFCRFCCGSEICFDLK